MVSMGKILIILAAVTIFAGGALSVYASKNPDGLEWSLAKAAGTSEWEAHGVLYDSAASIQAATALFPDYHVANSGDQASLQSRTDGQNPTPEGESDKPGNAVGTSTAGLAGAAGTFILAATSGLVITKTKKRKKHHRVTSS